MHAQALPHGAHLLNAKTARVSNVWRMTFWQFGHGAMTKI